MNVLNNIIVSVILLAGAVASVRWKKLTPTAGLAGAITGWLVFAGGGDIGLIMLAAFFILGILATSWKKKEKGHSAQTTRTMGQVLANGGVAALTGLAILASATAEQPLLKIMMAASLASATADTLSSELGMIYGRRYYNILTGKPDQRGLDGVISLEGLLIGIAGSAIIAGINGKNFWIIVIAGTIGNLADSILGASLERKGLIGNDTVNFLNTLIAALTAAALV